MKSYAPLLIFPVGYLVYWILLSRSRGKLFSSFFGYDSYEDLRKVSWRWFVAVMTLLALVVLSDTSSNNALLAASFALGYLLAHARFLLAPANKWARR